MKYDYVEEHLTREETGSYTAYAVVVEQDGVRVEYISDAFSDRAQAARFIDLCNELQPTLIHMRELIEDFLVGV